MASCRGPTIRWLLVVGFLVGGSDTPSLATEVERRTDWPHSMVDLLANLPLFHDQEFKVEGVLVIASHPEDDRLCLTIEHAKQPDGPNCISLLIASEDYTWRRRDRAFLAAWNYAYVEVSARLHYSGGYVYGARLVDVLTIERSAAGVEGSSLWYSFEHPKRKEFRELLPPR